MLAINGLTEENTMIKGIKGIFSAPLVTPLVISIIANNSDRDWETIS